MCDGDHKNAFLKMLGLDVPLQLQQLADDLIE